MLSYVADWALKAFTDPVINDLLSPLRLFSYISFRSAFAFITAFIICLTFGPLIIRKLISFKFGQNYNDIAAQEGGRNKGAPLKLGVPSMGGLIIHISVLISLFFWARWNIFIINCVIGLVLLAAVGFYDDYLKVKKRTGHGASGITKIVVQALVALILVCSLAAYDETRVLVTSLNLPFLKNPILQGSILIGILIVFLTVVGSSNAVNLTDGMDGLAIGCTIIVSFVFLIVTYVTGHTVFAEYLNIQYVDGAGEMTVLCATIMGAGLGFLWFNCHPAQVFMGDTGSLAIGGVLGIIAIMVHQPFLLFIAGGVFVMEAVSVIIQRYYFKFTRKKFGQGKRFFKMAPIHHHFEKVGWPETKVVVRFFILCIFFGTFALVTLKIR